MTFHSDIVANDFTRGVQRLEARVVCNGSIQVVDAHDPQGWNDVLLIERRDEFGNAIDPVSRSKDYFHALVENLEGGSYIFATIAHEDDECAFPTAGFEVPMREIDAA